MNPWPDFDPTDLQAVRDFLAGTPGDASSTPHAATARREPRQGRPRQLEEPGGVIVHNGISRARMRSTAKSGA